MSEPPLPLTAPERPDIGSEGRPPTSLHAVHLYISILPAAAVACLAVIAVTTLVVAGTTSSLLWPILAVVAVGIVAVLLATVVAADKATRRERQLFDRSAFRANDLQRRLGELGFSVSRSRQELHGLTERIAAGESPAPRGVDPRPPATGDPVVLLAHELWNAQNEAWNAVIASAAPKPVAAAGGGQARRVEVFVNLARRMQSLSHRAMKGLDELENQVEDPELLKGLFRVDHLSTRLRRQAESLAVIGGSASRRQWSRPVTVYEVLRSAIAEVEHYSRVKVVPPVEGAVDGAAAANVIHLLAELVENATKFSPPHTQVLLRAESVTAGLAIEIEDRGLGMPGETKRRLNELLTDPERVDADELLREGRIGLLVVSALSRRHKIVVRLQTNVYGGTQAVVVIPNELISTEPAVPERAAPERFAPERAASERTAHERTVQAVPAARAVPAVRTEPAEPVARREPVARPEALPARAEGPRPELPRRRPQANMNPELLKTPAPQDDDAEVSHDHGLMAAFMKGMRTGQDEN
ncbi:ATP-binding protein [Nonomuraea sp. NBC_01738]|uniref:sensor histidine kinase n=1 Tax=Nonomuraea sp. NBC_01738 TaxID=2976003 RepID=UPI002E138006|nr:ATP-binding protein [Nonomuraea sp. NBC_01738]